MIIYFLTTCCILKGELLIVLCVCWCRNFLFFLFSFIFHSHSSCSTLQHSYSIFHDFHRNFVFIAHSGFWVSYKSIINFHHGRINSSSSNTIQYVLYVGLCSWWTKTKQNQTKQKRANVFTISVCNFNPIYSFIDFIFVITLPVPVAKRYIEWIIRNGSTLFWIITGQFINWWTVLLYFIQNCSFHRLITSM